MQVSTAPYGFQDNSFQAAGGYEGVKTLVDHFYDFMAELNESRTIHEMHTDSQELRRDKLARFLCVWMGGPRLYMETYGPINIPQVHRHLRITEVERDAWLLCMQKAVDLMPYEADFKIYLMQQLAVPAERIRQTSQG